MNTTRMPDFSAEASFYQSSARYQLRAILAGGGPGGQVVPSLRVSSHCSTGGGVTVCVTCVDVLAACYVCSSGSLGCFWVR